MQQLEIEYFFPLTEQLPLDLDFTRCDKYEEYKRSKQNYIGYNFDTWSINGSTSSSIMNNYSIQFCADSNSVGYWKVGESVQMHNKKKPNWLHRQMTKIFFGWVWKNK